MLNFFCVLLEKNPVTFEVLVFIQTDSFALVEVCSLVHLGAGAAFLDRCAESSSARLPD